MQPKKQISSPQLDMFRNRLESILNHRHELYRLSGLIDWELPWPQGQRTTGVDFRPQAGDDAADEERTEET